MFRVVDVDSFFGEESIVFAEDKNGIEQKAEFETFDEAKAFVAKYNEEFVSQYDIGIRECDEDGTDFRFWDANGFVQYQEWDLETGELVWERFWDFEKDGYGEPEYYN